MTGVVTRLETSNSVISTTRKDPGSAVTDTGLQSRVSFQRLQKRFGLFRLEKRRLEGGRYDGDV